MKSIHKLKTKILLMALLASMYVVFCGYKVVYDDTEQKVYDDAGYFTDEEVEELEQYCNEVSNATKLEVIIHTTEDFGSKDRETYSDDYYDEHDFGYDQAGSGIMLVINQKDKQRYIDTKGIAIRYFDDEYIQTMGRNILNYLDAGDYAGGAREFLNLVEEHVTEFNEDDYDAVKPWFEGDYSDYRDFYDEHVKEAPLLSHWYICVLIAAGISALTVFFMGLGQKSSMAANANTYMDKDKYKIHQQSDIFIRRTTTRHKIEKDDGGSGSSGGGGSFHTSSSGSSHGGGGF